MQQKNKKKILRIVHNNIMRIQQHCFKYVNKKRKIASLLKKKIRYTYLRKISRQRNQVKS